MSNSIVSIEKQDHILLDVKEVSNYLNLGMTKTRQLLKENEKKFVVRIGGKILVHKVLLDKWLYAQVKR